MPMPCSTMAISPAVTCSPEATTASYSRASCSGFASRAPADEFVGLARHGGHHHRHLVAGVDLALDVACGVADALDVGDRRAAELQNQTGHAMRGVGDGEGRDGAIRTPSRRARSNGDGAGGCQHGTSALRGEPGPARECGRSNPEPRPGWGGRIRTSAWRNQNPLPYHLATPHHARERTIVRAVPPGKHGTGFGQADRVRGDEADASQSCSRDRAGVP